MTKRWQDILIGLITNRRFKGVKVMVWRKTDLVLKEGKILFEELCTIGIEKFPKFVSLLDWYRGTKKESTL